MNRFLKNVLGPIWLLIVASYYFEYHHYFGSSVTFWEGTALLGLVWAVLLFIIGGFVILKRRKILTITPVKIITSIFLFTIFTGATLYIHINPAVFSEPYQLVPYDETHFAVVEEGAELNEEVGAVIKRGTVIWQWDRAQSQIPVEIHPFFKTKSSWSFIGILTLNILKLFGSWLFLLFVFHNLGALILRQKKLEIFGFFESIGLGMVSFMGGLFALGALGILTMPFVWGITILAILLSVKKTPLFLQALRSKTDITFEKKHWWLPLLVIVCGTPLALNFIELIAPYPGGFDSMAVYHNTPNLLVQYGSLVKSLPAYNYELLFSLGHFLFGSSVISASISVFGALLAFGLFFAFLNKKFAWEESLLLVAFFVSLPMNQFMLHMDLKTDLPLLFFSLLAIYSALKSRYILTGIWLGVCFGIKYTAALLIFTIFSYFAFTFWGALAASGVAFISLFILGFQGTLFFLKNFPDYFKTGLFGVFLIVGLALLGIAFKKSNPTKNQIKSLALTGLFIALAFSPWVIKNGLESHSLSAQNLLNGSTSEVTEMIKSLDPLNACHAASYGDEIGRYSGYFEGSDLFLPLVIIWESTINSGIINGRINDIGFLFLGFAVFGFFAYQEIKKDDKNFKKIIWFTLLYSLLWLCSAQGVIWYGLPLFIGAIFLYGKAWQTEKWPYLVLAIWFVINFSMRSYETQINAKNLLYAGGLLDESIYTEMSNPGAYEMMEVLNSDENLSKNVYLVGGFMGYFVEHNDQRVYRDFLLDEFMCRFYDEDPTVILDRFRAANIEFIFFADQDINHDKDREKVLVDRFTKFKEFAETNLVQEVYRPLISLYSVPPL